MKKYLLFLCLSLCLILSSCSSATNKLQPDSNAAGNANSALDSLQEDLKIDVDLTELSTTMMYSEISTIMINYEDYVGKTIKMDGKYTMWYDEETYEKHYACYIMDTTACCTAGFDFVLADDFVFEENPALDCDIEVVGVYETYNQGELIYSHLVDTYVTVL